MNEHETSAGPDASAWAILELMGHRQLAGRICEVQRFGVTLCQIEMDRGPGEPPVVQLYGGAAIYGVTLTDEATVRRLQARTQWAGPVQVDPVRAALPAPDECRDFTEDEVHRNDAEAEPGADWCMAVEQHVNGTGDPPGPAPLEPLAAIIRACAGLDEAPALALLDELRAARAAAAAIPW